MTHMTAAKAIVEVLLREASRRRFAYPARAI